MSALAMLADVEWTGDVLTGALVVSLALGLVAFGFAWGRWRALAVLAVVCAVPLVLSDVQLRGAASG